MSREPYPSGRTGSQWKLVRPVAARGRPRKYDLREVVNGVLYVNSEGCWWRALPHDLPR